MPYVDLSYQDPNADIGNRLRKLDAYSSAGNSLAQGDYDTARNSLMQYGFPDDAQKVQSIHDSADANSRSNAAEGRTVSDRELAQTIGKQYAGGDTTGAKNAAIAAGKLDLANDYGTYEGNNAQRGRDQATRDAIAQAAKMTAAGDMNGARALLLPHYSTPDAFMQEVTGSQKAVSDKVAQLALSYNGDPDGWNREAIPTLHRMGINPQGYEGEAGLKRALAEGGQSGTVYKADQAAELKTVAGEANTKRAQALLASYQADPENEGVTVPSAQYQKLIADKNYMLSTTQDENGKKTAIAVLVDGRTKSAVDAAERVVKENQDANARDGGSRPTDFRSVYRDVAGKDSQEKNAEARMRMTQPELRGDISRSSQLGKQDAQAVQRQASVVQSVAHAKQLWTYASDPGADEALAPIQKMGGYQQWANLANSKRVAIPALLGNMRAVAAVLSRETANAAHVPGTGAEGDARNADMRNSLENFIMDSPNHQVLQERIKGVLAIGQGYASAPLSTELYNNPEFQGARKAEAAEATKTLLQPQVNGGISPLPAQGAPAPAAAPAQHSLLPAKDKDGNKVWFNTATGERTPRNGNSAP